MGGSEAWADTGETMLASAKIKINMISKEIGQQMFSIFNFPRANLKIKMIANTTSVTEILVAATSYVKMFPPQET